jgi:cytochrome c5
MSKQDSHFFNIFSLVIGLLVTIAVLEFALARSVAGKTQEVQVFEDSKYITSVQSRVEPFVHVAVAGQDNSALKIEAPPGAGASVALAVPKDGPALYQAVCSTCHATGLAGAPKAGDKSLWGPRIAQGKPTLYQHALQGFQGKTGVMPAKGGRTDLPDDLIKQGVDYLVSQAQK